jgi:hypothetical protein
VTECALPPGELFSAAPQADAAGERLDADLDSSSGGPRMNGRRVEDDATGVRVRVHATPEISGYPARLWSYAIRAVPHNGGT